jgi:acyl carrier protein
VDSDLNDQIRAYIREQFYVSDESMLANDRSLIGSGVLDSTGVLEVIFFVEETFGIHVEDDETIPANLDSIGAITNFVARKRERTGSVSGPVSD